MKCKSYKVRNYPYRFTTQKTTIEKITEPDS